MQTDETKQSNNPDCEKVIKQDKICIKESNKIWICNCIKTTFAERQLPKPCGADKWTYPFLWEAAAFNYKKLNKEMRPGGPLIEGCFYNLYIYQAKKIPMVIF